MAVVGHAYVVVRAITDKVNDDIRSAFTGSKLTGTTEKSGRQLGNAFTRGIASSMKDIDNPLTRAGNSFRKLYPEADKLRKAWVSTMRAGYGLQSGLGALVGSLSAVVGGLGGIIGAAGGASAALVAVGSAAITAKIGLGVAQFALGGVAAAVKAATSATGGYTEANKDALEALQQLRFEQEESVLTQDRAAFNLEKARRNMLATADLAPSSLIRQDATLAFREAELAYRRAKDRAADLKDQVAPDDKSSAGTDPFAGLTPSQKAFAEWLVGIQGTLQGLRESAASGFLPLLQEQMQRLIDSPLLGILDDKFNKIGIGAGLAVEKFVDKVLESENLRDLDTFLGNVAATLPTFGDIIGNVYDAILSVLVAADPMTRKFVGFLEEKTGAFAEWLDVKQATGELEGFFNRAGEIAAGFGTVFGNVFDGLGDIVMANFEPGSGGDRLLTWLGQVTDGFANIDKVFLASYFQGSADNFMAIGDALGGAIESLLKAGADPGIKEFWDALDAGSLAFESIVRNSVETAPKLGETIKLLTEIFEVFSDSGQVNAFFDTINFALGGVKDILVGLRPVIDFVGPIFAALSAVGLLLAGLSKVVLIFGSMAAAASTSIGTTIGLLTAQTTATAVAEGATIGLRAAITGLMTTNPIGWAVLAVSALAAVAVAIAGIHSSRMEEATKGITKAFDEGSFSADTFKDSLHKVTASDDFDYMIQDTDALKGSMEKLADAQDSWFKASGSTTALADTFGAVGRSLANIAVTNLPKAQEGFKDMKKELGLNNEELIIALDEMDEFKDALVDQADQLGINVRDIDGNIDKHKLLELALGEGEIAARKNAEAQKAIKDALIAQRKEQIENEKAWTANALSISGWDDALKQTLKDGKFDLSQALSDMETSIDESTSLQKGMLELKQKGLSEAGLQMIKDAGANAPALVEALLGASEAEFAKFDKMAQTAALKLSDTFNGAKTDLINAWADGKITDSTFNALYDGLEKATNPKELKAINDRIKQSINTVTLKTDLDLTPAKETLNNFKSSGLSITAYARTVDGRTGYATGGFISGPGGPKSDSIPAMLSNGEYVVNAKATSRYRSLLERINSEGNRFADGGLVGTSNGNVSAGINITVNPSPGMDEKSLAAAVSRELAFQIRKGSI